jgi:hypothetical protein
MISFNRSQIRSISADHIWQHGPKDLTDPVPRADMPECGDYRGTKLGVMKQRGELEADLDRNLAMGHSVTPCRSNRVPISNWSIRRSPDTLRPYSHPARWVPGNLSMEPYGCENN